jgi:hypothetical protein
VLKDRETWSKIILPALAIVVALASAWPLAAEMKARDSGPEARPADWVPVTVPRGGSLCALERTSNLKFRDGGHCVRMHDAAEKFAEGRVIWDEGNTVLIGLGADKRIAGIAFQWDRSIRGSHIVVEYVPGSGFVASSRDLRETAAPKSSTGPRIRR